jgi:hypothetical protein
MSKNIHILPTDKKIKNVGDLVKDQYGDIHIFTKNDGKEYGKTTTKLNIYITSDEEIKDDEWHLHYYEGKPVISKSHNGASEYINLKAKDFGYEKIILTTDQDLIADGVQAIDDEFLQWFVKNPNCEEIEFYEVNGKLFAEPIIPQETTLDEMEKQIAIQQEIGEKIVNYLDKYKGHSIYNEITLAIEFGYQLKLDEEDAKQQEQGLSYSEGYNDAMMDCQKNMYSKEDMDLLVNNLINKFTNWSYSSVYKEKLEEIYEQLKNK